MLLYCCTSHTPLTDSGAEGRGEGPQPTKHRLLPGGLPGIRHHLDPGHDLHVPAQNSCAAAQQRHQGPPQQPEPPL